MIIRDQENLRHGPWCDEGPLREACDSCRAVYHPAGESPRWIRGIVAGAALTGAIGVGFLFGHQSVPDSPARIGKDAVPAGIHCQEDEAIALVGSPVPTCVNVGELAGMLGGSKVTVRGVTYDVNDPNRPGCFMEPSDTPEGVEMILYSRISDKTSDQGLEVSC